ncbi:MAG TPA: hypothetical protein VMV27_17715 [Candidatus Binataceae bacterium]|nr:hypothetical protein [Candidatus Binataceae bacterium]
MEQKPPSPGDCARTALTAPARGAISERRLAANRANAQLSTGPRTARGKARSAQNALKHGMLARGLVIPKLEGRDAARRFDAMMRALVADLAPAGALEMLMVQEIGVCSWRLRRLLKYENRAAFLNSLEWNRPSSDLDVLSQSLLGTAWRDYEDDADRVLAAAGLNDLSMPSPEEVAMISRYEGGLMRHIFRAIDRLERLQRRRRVGAAEADTVYERRPYRTSRAGEIFEHLRGF